MAVDPSARLLSKTMATLDGCWEWTAYRGASGYGQFRYGGRMLPAHRAAYVLLVGPIPDGLQLDHLCRNRACVNPEHLEPVTPQVNVLRGEGIAAMRAASETCESGHPLSGANLYIDPSGYRRCRACTARWQREYKARRRAQLTAA